MSSPKLGLNVISFLPVVALIGCSGSKQTASTPVSMSHQTLASGISKEEVQLDPDHRLWIYKPKGLSGKAPLVLVAPAGSPLFLGMKLGDGDVDEETPYAEAGCIVVSYDISGPKPENKRDLPKAIKEFMAADAGVKDGKRAIDYALKSIAEADPTRVISAGHSSAGTLSLQLAQADPRIKACIAYAPVVDVPARLGENLVRIDKSVSGFKDFFQKTSPSSNVQSLKVPLFLFHADDDSNVGSEEIRALTKQVKGATLVEVPTGEHYDSMIHQGIPAAIVWLKKQNLIRK